MKILLTMEQVKLIEATLDKGDRVELIPVKDGVKIVRVKRDSLQ